MTVTSGIYLGAGHSFTLSVHPRDGAGNQLATTTHAIPAVGVTTFDIPAVARWASLDWTQTLEGNATDASYFYVQYDDYCNGDTPGGTASGCCPPDPAVNLLLESVLQLTTLIQRQAVPFAYLTSTVHSGLTGAGSIDIFGLLGVAVTVDTIPDSRGRSGTTPTEYFDLGYITFGVVDGFPHSVKLEHNGQLIMPARCSVFTSLSYDLTPGVEITITELVREP
jgi:hypothetical protein